jgi:uncharacterized OsmC-like protein
MRSERIDFPGHSGEKLAARLDLPDRAPRAAALFAHCFTCSKDIAAARRIARRLAAAGLGACTTMTIRLYARRKRLALDHVAVDVRHDRIHAEDCAGCESATGRIDRFRRSIRLEGKLDDDERRRRREIADRCPVHRTLEAAALIETEQL